MSFIILLCGLTEVATKDDEQLRKEHRQWVEEAIHNGRKAREPKWTESIALGSEAFVDGIREKLQPGLSGRKVKVTGDHYELREQEATYSVRFGSENVFNCASFPFHGSAVYKIK